MYNWLNYVGMQQGQVLMQGMPFGIHGKQLHGKQLSSYKLQVWPFSCYCQFL